MSEMMDRIRKMCEESGVEVHVSELCPPRVRWGVTAEEFAAAPPERRWVIKETGEMGVYEGEIK